MDSRTVAVLQPAAPPLRRGAEGPVPALLRHKQRSQLGHADDIPAPAAQHERLGRPGVHAGGHDGAMLPHRTAGPPVPDTSATGSYHGQDGNGEDSRRSVITVFISISLRFVPVKHACLPIR